MSTAPVNKTIQPSHKELLDVAQGHDRALAQEVVKIGKAIISVPRTEPAPIPQPHELDLTLPSEDPFGGNINNRKVAERIAGQNRRIYTNPHPPIHTGDPNKAARDVELSMEINPDAMSDNERAELQEKETAKALAKLPITPGSPAAKRQAEDRAKAVQANASAEVTRQTPNPQEAKEATSVVDRGIVTPPAWNPNAGKQTR